MTVRPLLDHFASAKQLLLFAIAVAGQLVLVPSLAAQPIAPYTVGVWGPPEIFRDPTTDLGSQATPTLRFSELSEVVRRALDNDPRIELVPLLELTSFLPIGDDSALNLANGSRDRGIEEYSMDLIPAAQDYLQTAVRLYLEGGYQMLNPRVVATAHEYLARSYLRAEDSAENRRRARQHFETLIRLRPSAEIRRGLFPRGVVRLFEEVYADLLDNHGEALAMPLPWVREIFVYNELEYLLQPVFSHGSEGIRFTLFVYARPGVLLHHLSIPVDAVDQRASSERVSRLVSSWLACLDLRLEPPSPDAPVDAGRWFLQVGWGAGVYLAKPTNSQFVNQGVGITVDRHFTENIGAFLRTNLWFGSQDPDGDLLEPFTSLRLSAGVMLSFRLRRFRSFLGTGLELNRVGAFTASNDIWCKISGGEPVTFAPGFDCRPSEVTRQEAAMLVGTYLMPGFSVDIGTDNEFSVFFQGNFGFYLGNLSGPSRDVDFPLAAEAGIGYSW